MSTKLSPPWCTYASMVKVLFEPDPEILVGEIYKLEDEDSCDYAFNIEVANTEKFLALNRVMSSVVCFGNVSLKVVILDRTDADANPYEVLFHTLFNGNSHLKDIQCVKDPAGVVHNYIRFQPEVLQFYNDDLTDYNGNKSCLAADIAYELFGDNIDASVNFCTAPVKENY